MNDTHTPPRALDSTHLDTYRDLPLYSLLYAPCTPRTRSPRARGAGERRVLVSSVRTDRKTNNNETEAHTRGPNAWCERAKQTLPVGRPHPTNMFATPRASCTTGPPGDRADHRSVQYIVHEKRGRKQGCGSQPPLCSQPQNAHHLPLAHREQAIGDDGAHKPLDLANAIEILAGRQVHLWQPRLICRGWGGRCGGGRCGGRCV